MFRMKNRQKWLALVVTAYLLSGGSGTVAAAPIQSAKMVKDGNNLSSSTTPYDLINVTQNSADSSITVGLGDVVFVGIGQMTTNPLVVYLTNPASGIYNVIVSNDGSQTTGKVEAAGIGSLAPGAVTLHGPVGVNVTAVGAADAKADAVAVGIGVGAQGTSVVTDAFNLSIVAQGGTSTTSAMAKAQGVTVGNDNSVSNVLLGVSGGTNNINVLAQGGKATASVDGTNVSASAYGVENYNVTTFKGATYINASAFAGDEASGGNYLAGSSTAAAYGVYNEGGTVYADQLVLSSVQARGGSGTSVEGRAYGLVNKNSGYISVGELRLEAINASAGKAYAAHTANALAYGINNETGNLIAGPFTAKVSVTAGVSDSGASATGVGVISGKSVGDSSEVTLGTDTGSNNIYVLSLGGTSTAADTNNSFKAFSSGVHNNAVMTIKGATELDVEANGGKKGPANAKMGEGYASAYGIYNRGSSLKTGDLTFKTVLANAFAGEEVHAEAYGFYNGSSGAVVETGAMNFINVMASGGEASTGGTSNAIAVALHNADTNGLLKSKAITGTVTSVAGSGGDTADGNAMGLVNAGNLEAESLALTVSGTGGTSPEKARSQVIGLTNVGTLTLNGGSNSLTVLAQGGLSSGTNGKVGATAYGVNNNGLMTLTDPLTLSVKAFGGNASGTVPGSKATDATAQSYGLYQNANPLTTGRIIVEDVRAEGGTGIEAQTVAVGLVNDSGNVFEASSVEVKSVVAHGGGGSRFAFARAAGINNTYGTFITKDTGSVNTINVIAWGGSITNQVATVEDAFAEGYGVTNEGTVNIKGATNIAVLSSGGTGAANDTSATAMGLKNTNGGDLTISGPLNILLTAASGKSGQNDAKAMAGGVVNLDGTVKLLDDVNISTYVVPTAGYEFKAASLYAKAGSINAGTDGASSLGKVVQLQGDVLAENSGTVINVTLDQPKSYLQGNVAETADGRVNLVVADGGVWRPVYDNTNGSFFDANNSATFVKEYTVAENAIARLTLKEGGNVDLTWDNPERDPLTAARSLRIGSLDGTNGTFKLNSNLAQNVADKLSLLAAAAGTQNAYIQVGYDPYLTTANLTEGSKVTGKAEVVSAAPDTVSFTGKQGEYNIYKYTPTLVKDPDGKWYLTALTIDEPAGDVTGPVRTVSQAALGLQELWLAEANNLDKRLGELRVSAPDTAGIWARYNHGKLEHLNSSVKYNLFQAGLDKGSTGRTENTYRGLAISHAKGTGDYELGSGDLSGTTLSLYQTGIKKGGQYYDVILKAGRFANDFDLVSAGGNNASGDYHAWAYSISGEYGVRKTYADGLYVEPQVELIAGRIQGADYTTSTKMKAHVDAQNKALIRLGIAAGKDFRNGSLYGKASFYHDFSGGLQVWAADGVNTVHHGEDIAHNWCELAIGGAVKAGKNATIYGELSKNLGQLTSGLQLNLGARWTF